MSSPAQTSSNASSNGGKPKGRICDVCKYRHQRCSGTQPRCHHCEFAGFECIYSDTPARLVRSQMLKKSPQQRKRRSGSIAKAKLRDGFVDDVLSSMQLPDYQSQRLRNIMLERLAEEDKGLSGMLKNIEPVGASLEDFVHRTHAAISFEDQSPHKGLLQYIDQWEKPLSYPNNTASLLIPPYGGPTLPSFQIARVLQVSFDNAYNSWLGPYNQEELDYLFKNAYLDRENQSKVVLCEISLVFALASRASNIPEVYPHTFWYDQARRNFEELWCDNENDLISIVRSSVLKALYLFDGNLRCVSSQIEYAYKLLRINCPEILHRKENSIIRSLVTLDHIMSSLEGVLPTLPDWLSDLSTGTTPTSPKSSGTHTKTLAQCFTSLSSAQSQIIRELYTHEASYGDYEMNRERLEAIRSSLPKHLQYEIQITPAPAGDQSASLPKAFVEVMYLVTRILLSRPILLKVIERSRAMEVNDQGLSDKQLEKYTDICVKSANGIVTILMKLLSEDMLPVYHTLSMHATFTALLVLVLEITRKTALGQQEKHNDFAIAAALSILEHHASDAHVPAQVYLKVGRSFHRRALHHINSSICASTSSLIDLEPQLVSEVPLLADGIFFDNSMLDIPVGPIADDNPSSSSLSPLHSQWVLPPAQVPVDPSYQTSSFVQPSISTTTVQPNLSTSWQPGYIYNQLLNNTAQVGPAHRGNEELREQSNHTSDGMAGARETQDGYLGAELMAKEAGGMDVLMTPNLFQIGAVQVSTGMPQPTVNPTKLEQIQGGSGKE